MELAILFAVLEIIQSRPVFHPDLLPRPSAVVMRFIDLLKDGTLTKAIGWSLLRISIGYSLATLLGIPLGIIIGRYWFIRESLGTLENFIRPIPAMAWIPIAILWFGIGIKSSSFLIFYGAFHPIVINSAIGVSTVDRLFVDSIRVSGGKSWDVFREAIIPAATPAIMTGMRNGLATAWYVMVTAEMFGARTGLGYLITAGQSTFRVDTVMVGIIIIGLVGFGLDRGFRKIEARALRWRI